jgi:hypothetical protein
MYLGYIRNTKILQFYISCSVQVRRVKNFVELQNNDAERVVILVQSPNTS